MFVFLRDAEKKLIATVGITEPPQGFLPQMNEPLYHLDYARHDGGDFLSVRFSDGLACRIDLARQLHIKTKMLRLSSAKVSRSGTNVEVKDKRGRTVPIDGADLRAACDPTYALQAQQAFSSAYVQAAGELLWSFPSSGVKRSIRCLTAATTRRLHALGRKSNQGTLTHAERDEYAALSREVEQLTIKNALSLTGQE